MEKDTKKFDQTNIREISSIALDSLNEIYDMTSLIREIKINFEPICEMLHAKRLECEIVPSDSKNVIAAVSFGVVIYEAEGPEFESIMYSCTIPSGEIIQCSITYKDFNLDPEQLRAGKDCCEMLCLYVSRARIAGILVDTLNKDPSTGLANMGAFFKFGDKLFAESKIANYVVVSLNIANFKYVNQTVPFEVGTSVLVKYAHALLGLMKPEEMITKSGADNFIALIKKEHLDEFVSKVKTIPVDIKDGSVRVHFELNCYAGIYDFETRTGIQVALECANNAKAVAKRTPHSPFVYYNDAMGEEQRHENYVRASFHDAMERREFVAYYQPKVNIETQKIVGMEALVRWVVDGKVLSPGVFVPILENTRAIIELDRCMLLQVCRDIKRWESMEIKVPRISVNLSRRNLTNPGIADEIAAILDEYHVDHDNVEIEVTETMDSSEFESLRDFIAGMKKHNIKVSIDDFGTGYSSLNLLKNIDADVLKIDRSFINKDKFTAQDKLLVGSIIKLANAYDMEVITEGVETEKQIEFLRKVKCENVQGYFFDKPLSKEEVTSRIKKGYYKKEMASKKAVAAKKEATTTKKTKKSTESK